MRLASMSAGVTPQSPYWAGRLSWALQVSALLECSGQGPAALLTEEGGGERGPLSSPNHAGLENVDQRTLSETLEREETTEGMAGSLGWKRWKRVSHVSCH